MKTIGIISANYTSKRFGEITKKRTLASIPYGGRYRLIDFTLSNMTNAGIQTVGVIAPYNSSSLIDHIGIGIPWNLGRKVGGMFIMPGSLYGINISNSKFILRDFISNRQFLEKDDADYVIISSSSDIYNADLRPFIEYHDNHTSPVTALYKTIDNAENYTGFFFETNSRDIVSRMNVREAGQAKYFMDCFIIDRTFLIDFLDWFAPLEYMDIMDIISDNLDSIDVGAYEFRGYLRKVSNIQDYFDANMDLLNENARKALFHSELRIKTKVQDEAPVRLTKSSNVKNSIISTGCTVEGTVENSIIFRTVHIAKGAVVKNSIIMQHGEIGSNARIENVICDKYVQVADGVEITGGDTPIVIGRRKKV